jgi:signal transduction histidine kinase
VKKHPGGGQGPVAASTEARFFKALRIGPTVAFRRNVATQPTTAEEWTIESAERQKGMLTYAAALACFFPADAFIVHRWNVVLVGARLAWALMLVAAAATSRVLGPARTGLVDLVLTLGSQLCFLWIVLLTGGAHSPYLPWFLVMPIALTPFTMRNQKTSTLGWAIAAGASTTLLLKAGTDEGTLVVWLFLMSASGFVAMFGTAFQSRLAAKLVHIRAAREAIAAQLAEADRERSHSERLALVGQLAAGVAHEINNPLAFVHANLAFVRVEAERLPEAARLEVLQALHEADRGVERIKSIVRDLGVFARKAQEALELCYLGDVVADAMLLARVSAPVPLQCVTLPGLPPVRAVPRHLGQVVLNLLVNAAEALEPLPPGAERAVNVRVYLEGEDVCVSVEDTGAGFPAGLQDRLFEPFFTTKPVGKGTGLGLALSREYVERYGGRLLAENRAQGGARFSMRLPALLGGPPADAPWEKDPIGDPDITPTPRKRSRPRPSA